jgi:histidinol-phosphate aminotransferase
MPNYFRPNVEAMAGYAPGEQPRPEERVIKLNTNENPYPPGPRVMAALRDIPADALRRYPDPMASRLRRAASQLWGVPPEMILAGNGSDDLLTIAVRSFAGEGDTVAFPWPTYSLYDSLCEIQGARALHVDWPDDFRLPAGLADTGAKLVFVANPNAPSGTFVPVEELERFASRLPGVLAVDEAYADFAEDTFLRVIRRHRNVIVLRTLSKSYSLAGARIGLAVGDPELIAGMVKVKDSYNVDALCDRLGAAALEDQEHFRAGVDKIKAERARLTGLLAGLGFRVLPSRANFVLARRPAPDAKALYLGLKERGVLVRFFDRPGLRDALRITVGLPEETDALIAALGGLLPASPGR